MGQSSLEHLILVGVALLLVAVAVKYTLPASKETPITGITYIDPELSPLKPGYNHPVSWTVHRYPPGCKVTRSCDFYVSVNLHYYPNSNRYKVWVYANGDSNKIREIHVRLWTGESATWKFPEDKGKNKIRGVELREDDFPCELYVMVYQR